MNGLQTQRSPLAGGLRGDTTNDFRNQITTSAHPVDVLLPRLEGVIKTDQGWRSKCPSCGGHRRKVAIAETNDGTLLLHCFGGCGAHQILEAVGLEISDLFVRRDYKTMTPAERSQLRQAALIPRWRAALDVLSLESTVLMLAADKLSDGIALDDDDISRVRIAHLRIHDCKDVLHG